MLLTSDQAFELIFEAGILTNKQTFLRFVREGRIVGDMNFKRQGYRFKKEEIMRFIEETKEEERENPLVELKRLRQENEELRFRLKTPATVLQAENLKLVEKLRKAESYIRILEEKIEKIKYDQTIRIRVE